MRPWKSKGTPIKTGGNWEKSHGGMKRFSDPKKWDDYDDLLFHLFGDENCFWKSLSLIAVFNLGI